MFNSHKKAIKAFKAESAETKDADVKSFGDKSIPVLEEHLKLITAIKNRSLRPIGKYRRVPMQCGSRRSVSRKSMALDLPGVIGTEPAVLNVKVASDILIQPSTGGVALCARRRIFFHSRFLNFRIQPVR